MTKTKQAYAMTLFSELSWNFEVTAMEVSVIATIATGVISALGAFMGAVLTNNKRSAVLETKMDDVKDDIKTLSTRVDKHNNLIERMTRAEAKIENLESQRRS